ncbi:MAG: rhomboid family intramembrane serine protease [Bacteriovoracaceae bacterium]|nr:rhomboid family intramembrane serine protease [Bacteriovoracaceae bacterium]
MLKRKSKYKILSIVVPLIIFINIIVYLFWFLASGTETQLIFMSNNFLVSWNGLEESRYWTILTSAFSHNRIWHLFMNMFVLGSFGRIVEATLGTFHFLKFYLLAACVSSLGHAFVSYQFLNEPDIPALGASGAIAGVILLFSLLYPKQKILLLGFIPLPAIAGTFLFIGLDLWGLIAQAEGGGLPIGHGAHLSGAFVGILYYFIFLRKRIQ